MADPKDKPKPKPPPPPQALRTFLNLSAAVPPQYGVDPTKPLLKPYVPTRGQVRAQAGLMGLADLVRGLTVGATDEKDSNAAQIGELIQTGVPLLKGAGLGLAAMQGGLKIVKGAETAEEAAQAARTGIRAYHGSPHDFDKFDLSKIGTGEGAQAYGHGLYFAEREGVARGYRDALGRDALLTPEGQRIVPPEGTVDDMALAWLKSNEQPGRNPYQEARRQVRELAPVEHRQAILDKLHEWQDAGHAPSTSGRMYEVDINADPEHFLDWDAPLSGQSSQVQEATRALVADAHQKTTAAGQAILEAMPADPTGEQLHTALSRALGGTHFDQTQIPNALKERGIPGIRYLDQPSRITGDAERIVANYGSREKALEVARERLKAASVVDRRYWDDIVKQLQTPESRNYVAFDDALIDILHKYGWLPPIAGLGALSQIDRKAVEQRPQ